MQEGQEEPQLTGSYPSSGMPEESSGEANPFGPDAEQEELQDPFAPSPEIPSADTGAHPGPGAASPSVARAEPSASGAAETAHDGEAGGSGPEAERGYGRPARASHALGVPLVDRSQIRDPALAAAWGLDARSVDSAGGAAATTSGWDSADASDDAHGAPPAGTRHAAGERDARPGSDPSTTALSAERAVPQDVFSDSQEMRPETPGYATAYPSASAYPSATALPVRSAQGRNLASGLRRMMRSENLPTAPMRIVQRLANTPFANPRRNQANAEVRKTLNFAVRLAEVMFHFGAGSLDVETAIAATCATYGVENVDVDITNQSVTINYVSGLGAGRYGQDASADEADIYSHTVVRVVRSWSDNYAGLTATHRLVKTIIDGDLSRAEAERHLDRIMAEPKPYPRWMILWANVLAACALTIGIGGTWQGAALAGATFLAVQLVTARLGKWGIPSFFVSATGSAIITAVAMSAFGLGLGISPPHVVASGLIMLLPTLSLVSTLQDAINGFPVTAAGRMVSTGLTFLGLIAGLAVAIAVTTTGFGLPQIEVQQAVFTGAEPVVHVGFMLAASAFIAVTLQVKAWHIVPGVLSGAVGLCIYYLCSELAVGPRMVSMVAAVGVGCSSAWIARRYTIPQLVIAVPGLTFLLPGLSIFRGMYMFTVDVDPVQGLVPMINAGAIILSLAAAVVLGNYLMRPFMRQRVAAAH